MTTDKERWEYYSKLSDRQRWILHGLDNPEWVDSLLHQLKKQGIRDTGKDFDYDLQVGKTGERLVDKLLTGPKSVEVKLDNRTYDTGNIAIEEAHSYGKSGIAISKANWYALVLGGGYKEEVIVFVKTSRLKRILKAFGRKNKKAGIDGRSRYRLIHVFNLFATDDDI